MSTDTATGAQTRLLVVCRLGAEEYGVPITLVREVIRYSAPRPIPGGPRHVEGVINLRGRIIPVVGLRTRLGAAGRPPDDARVVIVELPGATVGVVVDEVTEVLSVSAGQCEALPEGAGGAGHLGAVARLDGRLLVILEMERLLCDRVAPPSPPAPTLSPTAAPRAAAG